MKKKPHSLTRTLVVLAAWIAIATPPLACRPDLGDRDSLITRPQVLAVRGDPPEAKPGEAVHYSLLIATPDGPVASPLASWAFCTTPKLLTENGAASVSCLADGVHPLGDGSVIDAVLPADACALFGPEITSADLRPRDPDITGGYYQPLRATVFFTSQGQGAESRSIAYGLERISCKLANASAAVTTDFGKRYVANKNPELAPLIALSANANPVALDAVPRGATITLRASWPETERYVVYDLATQSVVERRESMRVTWSATAGTFESDRTGRSEDEVETFTDNRWTAPNDPRTTHLFTVLRDARGGVAFTTYAIVTQ